MGSVGGLYGLCRALFRRAARTRAERLQELHDELCRLARDQLARAG